MTDIEKQFLDMINTHRGIMYKICHLYGKEKAYKEDLLQEIVLQLWRSFPTFRHQSSLSTWMYRVALNTAISQFRKGIRIPENTPLSREEFQIPDLSVQPQENENLYRLDQAIGQLTNIEKAVIMLYLEDKTYQDIAEITGLTVSNVGVKLNRIKTKLENIIKQDRYESRQS